MGFFKNIGRTIQHTANRSIRQTNKLGQKFAHDGKKLGIKVQNELRGASKLGKKLADGVSMVNNVIQDATPILSTIAGPYAPAVLGAAKAVDVAATGVSAGRKYGNMVGKHIDHAGRDIRGRINTLKDDAHALQKDQSQAVVDRASRNARDLIRFGSQAIKPAPRPDVLL